MTWCSPSTTEGSLGISQVVLRRRPILRERGLAVSRFAEHMPKSHKAHLKWTPPRIIHWAETMGRGTAQLVRTVLESRAGLVVPKTMIFSA
jgi:hypothetical protein